MGAKMDQCLSFRCVPSPGRLLFLLGAGAVLRASLAAAVLPAASAAPAVASVHGQLAVWGDVVVDFTGPATAEQAVPNPFLDFRLTVTFRHTASGLTVVVPGHYAADGNAGETGATAGATWRAHLLPALAGPWTYTVSFRAGPGVAVSLDPAAGVPTAFNGTSGTFTVAPVSASAPGFHEQGLLKWTGTRYLHFAGSGEPFLKSGANSPENLLACADFDATTPRHTYAPHVVDWKPGDPTWKSGAGKGLIGALNYLASRGVNALYFLTFNVGGDGNDVWPWTAPAERLRFDVSKLDQWNVVFDHMDDLGIMLHVVLQESEIDKGPAALDGGGLGTQRTLYYRELIARFGHHLGVQWNLGEENTSTTAQQTAFIASLRALDPYDHPIAVHTFPTTKALVYSPLLQAGLLESASLQVLDSNDSHAETAEWVTKSAAAGRPWCVSVDEIGPPSDGVVPDAVDQMHDTVRREVLWGNLLAGGAGCEWYFGYGFPNDDLDCENFRTRETMWDLTRHAREFCLQQLPLDTMVAADALVSATASGAGGTLPAWCLAQAGEVYAVYLPQGGAADLDLGSSTASFSVGWYDPRTGGALQPGNVASVRGPGLVALGGAPHDGGQDWALLVSRWPNSPPAVSDVSIVPSPFLGYADLTVSMTVSDPDGGADVQAAKVYFFSPALQLVGSAVAAPAGPGQYVLTVPSVPPLPPGKWVVVAVAIDAAGAMGFRIKTFGAQ